MKVWVSFILLLSGPFIAHAASTLSPVENQIQSYIVQQRPAQIALLKKLVNINSGTSNLKGIYRVGHIIQQQLNALGFKTHWAFEPPMMRRAGTLIAESQGKKGKRLLLIGHLDTVFSPAGSFKTFTQKDNTAKGPGIIDDKGGVVVLLYTLKALHSVHALDDATILVVLTGDEEDSGKPSNISRKPLIEAAKQAEIALDFEPSISQSTVSIARRGIGGWAIETKGNESHSATLFLPEVGDGAIFEMARILTTMRIEFERDKKLVLNPGIVLGGNRIHFEEKTSSGAAFGKDNVVSKTALAHGDYRFENDEQKAKFKTIVTKIVDAHLPGTHSMVTFEEGIPAMAPTPANLKLLTVYSQASKDLGQGDIKPLPANVRGAGDISYVAAFMTANLAGLGPIGSGTHSSIESIQLDSLTTQTERAAIFMYRLLNATE